MSHKGQQKLTTFSDFVEEGLSYLQLFLELPETIWSLQNRLYTKKYHFSCNMSGFVKPNLAFGLIYSRGRKPKIYIAQKYDQRGGLLLCFAVLALFLGYKTFLSNQKVSGSYKNSYRKLRMYTFRS